MCKEFLAFILMISMHGCTTVPTGIEKSMLMEPAHSTFQYSYKARS
jgi:starvation-inducible outer membrane lipoprotein